MTRTMKDSGIEWIGEIPEDWKVATLKHYIKWKSEKGCPNETVLSLYRDYGVVPKDSRDDNHNVTSLDTSSYKVVDVGDFVVNKMKAWQGSMAISKYRGIISPAYHVCTVDSTNINLMYFHYLLRNKSYLPEYTRLSTGMRVGQWDLSFDDFRNIPFVIPSISEQQKIADFLDEKCSHIDSVQEKTRASIDEYKQLKQSVITKAVTKGIRPNRPMKDSGIEWIGIIPEDWKITKLNRLFNFIGGYAFDSKDFCDRTTNQILRIGNIRNDLIIKEDKQVFVSNTIAEKAKAFKVQEGDILFSMTGTKGKRDYFYTVMYSDDLNDNRTYYINQRVGCFRKKEAIAQKYYCYLLKDKHILDSIFLYETGTANQGNLGIETIKHTRLQYPSLEEQIEIVSYLDTKCTEIDKLISKKEQLIEELETYKKSLIYEYVTGKKEVC